MRSTTLFAEGNLVLCPLMRNDVSLRLNDVASELANDVVSLRTQTQKETLPKRKCFFLEAPPRIELGIRALQAPALPLGHGAGYLISLKKGA